MDWIRQIIYFKITKQNNNTVVFTPKEIIHDIYFDTTKNIIPYTNGKCYLVYQDITFKIINYLQKINPNLTVQLNKNQVIPEIIIKGDNLDDTLLSNVNKIMTNYINSKFSLFISQAY